MAGYHLEEELGAGDGRIVLGVDEAGRGPWAGPVVAAAVWLDPAKVRAAVFEGVRDSKALAQRRRQELLELLRGEARVAVGIAETGEIDRLNILQASLLAMRRAVEGLGIAAEAALIDGNVAPKLGCPCRTGGHGDRLSLSSAAAAIALVWANAHSLFAITRRP